MKRLALAILLLTIAVLPTFAQSQQHGIQLTWTDSDPLFPSLTFDVYRLAGSCPTSGTTGFVKLDSAPFLAQSYFDPSPVAVGQNVCYYLVAWGNGLESAPSATTQVTFQPTPFAPPAPTAVVK